MKIQNYKLLLVATIYIALSGCSLTTKQAKSFKPAEEAVLALEDAVASRSIEKADALFGVEGEYILHTGDPVLDRERGRKFVKLFEEGHRLESREDGAQILVLGKKSWPFPVPIVKSGGCWVFDVDAGREEILTRLIGSNELSAIDVLHNIYLAQRIYSAVDWDRDGVLRYASRLISTTGNKDGLYWPVNEGEELSPLGPAVLKAADEDYTINQESGPQPYRGFYFKLFTTPASETTSPDILSKPGSYWLIASPALWGTSGVMTFAMNERGWIYEKNLGENYEILQSTPVTVDGTWTRIE